MRALTRTFHPRSFTSPSHPLVRVLQPVRATSGMNAGSSPLLKAAKDKVTSQIAQAEASNTISIHPILKSGLDTSLAKLSHPAAAAWAKANKFNAKSGEVLLLPSTDGAVSSVLLGLDSPDDLWGYAALPSKLPAGTYKLQMESITMKEQHNGPSAQKASANVALLGWILGCYKFSRYKTGKLDNKGANKQGDTSPPAATIEAPEDEKPMLITPEAADISSVYPLAAAFYWCRDLINTPAEDMGPQHLAREAENLVSLHRGATLNVIEGDALLEQGYPAIHTVGRAAARQPLLIDINWCPEGVTAAADQNQLPLLALVGKGVCFDSGGLDIKTAAGMKLMKKDMGGAALVLSLAHVIMSAQLPVRLRVLVPAVENAISGNAYRPGDVLQTRAGLTVENGNTDAEGRLILCDAIYEAALSKPDLLVDAATLTGAARVALGPELPAVFSSCDETWSQLEAAAKQEADPLWRLPLWPGYRKALDSKVADIGSTGEPGSAGAIIAALFLSEFAKEASAWVHIDTAGWVSGSSTGPGRPEGGEALGLRALWRLCRERYGRAAGNSAHQPG